MHILELQATNVKKLRAIQITPNGKAVIGGKNRQGKSTALDSILYACGGKRRIPDGVVREGEESAEIVVRLSADPENGVNSPLIVTRTIRKDGKTELEIRVDDKFGGKITSPQSIMEDLLGPFCFDPTALITLPAAKRLELAKEIVGLDFSDLDAERKKLYDDRTFANKQGKDVESAARQINVPPDTPESEVSVSSLLAERKTRERHNADNRAERQRLGVMEDDVLCASRDRQIAESELEAARAEVKRLESVVANASDVCGNVVAMRDAQAATVAALEDSPLDAIDQRVAEAEVTNAAVRLLARQNELLGEAARHKQASESLTARIRSLDDAKATMLQDAEWPIEGMGFGNGDITWQGRSFELASQAEQLSVGVALLAAKSPRLKVALIRNGAFFDEESLQAVLDTCEKHGLQPWIERVGKGSECSVIIEEGAIWTPPAEEEVADGQAG